MVKKHYQKELKLKGMVQVGDNNEDAKRVQEWLNLYPFFDPSFQVVCSIDGEFGPQTERAVKNFQDHKDLEVDGVVGPMTWDALTEPMQLAYDCERIAEDLKLTKPRFTARQAIVACAYQHLLAFPRELRNKNEGPWVRAYMGGKDGSAWAWCVGSTLSIIDQGLSMKDLKFTDYLPNTYSCDKLGSDAIKKETLIRNEDLRKMTFEQLKETVKPGDIVNVVRTPTDWTHTALILEVHESHFVTWEGNTNDEGSREGFEVCLRKRKFRSQNLDVILLNL